MIKVPAAIYTEVETTVRRKSIKVTLTAGHLAAMLRKHYPLMMRNVPEDAIFEFTTSAYSVNDLVIDDETPLHANIRWEKTETKAGETNER